MNSKKIVILYILWGLITFLLFLYLLFPKDILSKFITNVVEENSTDIKLKFAGVDPILPPGVKFDDIDIYYMDNLVYRANYLKIVPGISSLFSDRKSVNLSASAFKGFWKCKVKFSRKDLFFDTLLKDVRLDLLPIKEFLPDYRLSGVMNLDAAANIEKGKVKDGDIDFNVKNLKIRLGARMFGIRRLLFSDVHISGDAKDNKIKIKTFQVNGKEVSGNLTGTIEIRLPYEQSVLDIKGTIEPDPVFIKRLSAKIPVAMMLGDNISKGGVPFTLKGTIESPDFNPEI